MNAPNRFIRPEVLARISNLELLARTVVEGFVSGLHRSPFKGFSAEFMQYRPYTPGDDPAFIDWKLYARSDRYYIKETEDETNTSLHLLVDQSQSMAYASQGVTKLDYAFYLAASLAYFMVRQRDAVGLTLFDDRVRSQTPPRSTASHLHALLHELDRAEAGAGTSFGKPLHDLADRVRRRGFVVLVSDLLSDPKAIVDGLRHFRYRGHQVIVFHTLDPQEVRFEFDEMAEFEDLETGRRMLVDPAAARARYLEQFERYRETLRQECSLLGIDYTLLTTDQPLDFALFEFLSARARRGGR